MKTQINDLQPGQIVYLAQGTRHDVAAFPYAIVVREAQAIEGGGVRYRALLVDCAFKPTQLAYANVYDDEIVAVSRCPPLPPEVMAQLREKAGG